MTRPCLAVIVGAMSLCATTPARTDPPHTVIAERPAFRLPRAVFTSQREAIDRDLRQDAHPRRPHAEQLARIARAARAGGDFKRAACAAWMWLDAFGCEQPNAELMIRTLIEGLAPLNVSSYSVADAPDGPVFEPVWHTRDAIDAADIELAMAACEWALMRTADPRLHAWLRLRQGWLHRARNAWDDSTAAFDRCAREAEVERDVADALWLAAENLRWQRRPQEAARRWRELAQRCPDDLRADVARQRAAAAERQASTPGSGKED
jgi:tetratricopeptide (TPR) repeat protein